MYPVLLDLGLFKIYSFGLMIAVAFFVASWLVSKELERRRIEPAHMEGYPLAAMLGGIVGARLYYVFEHLDKLARNPLGTLFGGSGLTWYGGAAGGALAVLLLARRRKQPLWSVCDAFAPGLAAAYAIGRIGCQLAGDGDYGIPSDLPWAMAYPNAIVPTDVPVHPTPVYEMLAMGLATAVLWRLRTRPWANNGRLFGLYLIFSGSERFLVEFVRTNARVILGLSAAQVTSIIVVVAGFWIMAARPSNPQTAARATRRAKKARRSRAGAGT
jgi:phosphatidylglycerol---prolipoprotein diacylglyceryl transferase